ncbi:MAG: sigma-54 dependent transcriptional regulator [Polyangiales bacterium]
MNRSPSARLLLVDDDDDSRSMMARALRQVGHQVVEAEDGSEAKTFDLTAFDVVLTDLQMPRVSGQEVLAAVRAASPDTPVIAFTAYANAENALDLMAAGAYDYLPRPVDLTRLKHLVQRALEWRALVRENSSLREGTPSSAAREQSLVGTSPAMLEVYKVIAQVAPTSACVLIVGESGTGKELVARTIHRRSGRGGPFVAVAASALPEGALAAELFGREDAAGTRKGMFEEATGGTLYIDEIETLGPAVQARLLRFIEERAITREGGTAAVPLDVRLVVASSRDLEEESASGRFRSDLLFRLQVVTLTVPPLTARREDIPVLVDHFLGHYAAVLGRPVPTLAPDARRALMDYDWPGNVRELAQSVERALVLARGRAILKDDLPASVRQHRSTDGSGAGLDTDWPELAVVERRYIDRVLQHTGGNKTRAAEVLGIDRRTLSRLFARERAQGLASLANSTDQD